jgi:divalent metal cation (Fe/Co/Zn/Cd) transporter
VLFTVGSLFALAEGIDKLVNPEPIESPLVAYVVLAVAVVLEAMSLRTARREAAAARGDRSWWQFVHTTKNPELPVVLLEDTGALVGLVMAFAGITLAEITGNDRWDATGSLGIGVLLGVIAIVLATEMKSLLIGESASPTLVERITRAIRDGPEVERVIHLRTLHLSPDELLVATKLELSPSTVPELARAIDTVEARVRASVPEARYIFVEPDLFRHDEQE